MRNTLHPERILWIDLLRGIAILLMIPANYGSLWSAAHPMWFRIASSMAAPTFIMLSAGMMGLNKNKHSFRYYMLRSGIIIGFGVLIDILVWKYFPFTTFDVLYIIGFSIPLLYLCQKYKTSLLFCLSAIIFIMTPIMQQLLGYQAAPLNIYFAHPYWPGLWRIIHSFLVDGWFPMFPWLGYSFFGAAIFRQFLSNSEHSLSPLVLLLSISATIIGFCLLLYNVANGGIITSREGYCELFYPATLPFIVASCGAVVVLCWLAQKIAQIKKGKIVATFGRYSLFLYILHSVVEVYVIIPVLALYGAKSIESNREFFLVTLTAVIAFYFLCRAIDYIKIYKQPSSLILQLLFGKEASTNLPIELE